MKDMAGAKSQGKAAMLPGTVQVKSGVTAGEVVPDPLAIAMNVRRLGVAFHVSAMNLNPAVRRFIPYGRRAMRRNKSASDVDVVLPAAASPVSILRISVRQET